MKKKMKTIEVAKNARRLNDLVQREADYVEKCGCVKFPPKVSIAIAKNVKALMDEFKLIIEQQEKNEKLAEKKDVKLEDLQEQKDLVNTDVEVEICTIAAEDLETSQVTAADVLALMFMTEEEQKEGGN